MLILKCPYCGVACDETELDAGGEAHLTRHGPGSSDNAFEEYMFMGKTHAAFISSGGGMPMGVESGSMQPVTRRRLKYLEHILRK